MITIFNGRKRSLGGQTSEVWAQIDVAFRDHIHLFKGARLGVFLAIALHADADGWAWPSYDLLARETGYNRDTVSRALGDLCNLTVNGYRVLLRYQPQAKEGQFTSNRYLLFPSAQEVSKYAGEGVHHLGAETGGIARRVAKTPTRQKPYTENRHTKKNHPKQQPHAVVVDLSAEQQTALDALTGLGVDPSTARILAGECDPGDVAGWVAYARGARGLDNAPGLVVARLKAGEPAPTDGDRDDRRRFIEGEFAEYVQH